MADVGAKLFPRGKTYFNAAATVPTADRSGHSEDLLGLVRNFEDLTPGALPVPAVRRSMGHVICMLVRNTSAGVLKPKQMVTWKAGKRGKEVDGQSCTTAQAVAGVVDEFLPSGGVQVGDVFWLTIKGHTHTKLPWTGAEFPTDISAGDIMIALTAATSGATTGAGRVQKHPVSFTVTETTNGSAINVLLNSIGVAAEAAASTDANTDGDLLVELDTHWRG